MSAPQLVLLHGVGLDHTMWDAVRRELGTGLDVVAPDLLGHGTAPPAPSGCTLADLVSHAMAQFEGSAHVVGFSLGGMVGQSLALRQSERVRSLTCVSTVYDRSPTQQQAVLSRWQRASTDFEAAVAAAVERWFPPERNVDPSLVARTRRVLLANNRDSYLRAYRVFATADEELTAHLSAFSGPLLAVTGDLDQGSTPRMSEHLAAAVPHGRSRVVPGVGHMLPEERPAELARLISTFVKEHHDD